MHSLAIGEVADRAQVRPSTIRYYERAGLLPEPERISGRRRYDGGVFKRLAVIRMAQEAGFTIEEIRTLFTGFPEDTPASERWQELARRKVVEVDALIQRMQQVRQVLEESLTCNCLTLDACGTYGWRIEDEGGNEALG
jgi:MerR family transcriptional regulator, redox-sensitive transcriptional activator SoxR